MKRTYYQVSRLGSDNLAPLSATRVVLINHVCLFMCFLAVFFTFFWIARGAPFLAMANVILALFQISFIWMNHKRYYTVSSFLIVFFSVTPLFFALGMVGRDLYIQNCLIPMAGFSVLLFELEEKKKIAITVGYSVLLLVILEFYDYKLFTNLLGPPPRFIVYFTYGMNLLTILVLTIYLFRAHNVAYQNYERARKQIDQERARTMFGSRMSALGEMAGGIAHEINNPLALILMTSESLKKNIPEGNVSQDRLLESLTKISDTSLRIGEIVKSLSVFSRGSQSRTEARAVNLRRIIEDTLVLCKHRFKIHGVALTVNVDESIPHVTCRPVEVGQVLLNLLNNAFDAVASLPNGDVSITLTMEEAKVLLRVKDNGPGVPKEIRDRIFEAFYTTKEEGKGTGLGLSISKRLMEENNGKLILEETPSGATFKMELPV